MSSGSLDRSIVPAPGPLRPFRFPHIERFSLDNGMPVLFARTRGLPVATFSLLLPAGALREPPEVTGIASLTSAALESGTTSMDAARIAERLEEQGVRFHAGTSWEVSQVDFTSLVDRSVAAAEIASELVRAPVFPADEIERLRQEQFAGIMQRRAEPRGLANEMIARFIFDPASPFARPLSGTAESVSRLTRDHAVDFHRSAFTSASAGLIVAGNLSAEEVREAAQASFGSWTGPAAPPVEVSTEPRSTAVQLVVVDRPGAVQSEIRIGHVGVARGTPDYFPLLVMNTILGGAFSSRLNLNLRERHGFTYGVSSTFIMRRHPGPFLVSTAVQTEVTGAAVTEILRELDGIRQGPVSDAELSDARQFLAGTYPLRLQTTDGVASRLADLFIYGLPDTYLEEFAPRVLAVTADQVLEAARQRIHPDRLTILVVGDAATVVPQLEALNLGGVEVVTVDTLP